MKAYMTNGTYSFLKQLEQKYHHKQFLFMENEANTLAYYEGEGKSIFASGRTYDILQGTGTCLKRGFVAMHHIPVTEEGQPVFEHQMQHRDNILVTTPGFQAFRFLKPTKGHVYVILTQWSTKAAYESWKATETYTKLYQNHHVKLPAYFADRPFNALYHMVKEDDEKQ
ncbi:antibiotic biosynthesis monooxygenase family protein [Virgibacillus soli]|uniref:Antibiotic biosynthesis monooxygenase n=1 Tax=Paracerasibacillus soli TaxID=480284 RepID=A0ABU5CNA3_9BACI|nr:antibiotic biosynthesis monooxygenase [Virgibacillus soli]MDY0407833.1 antibiotic biosynthesis monooxygenase [Virgibacillus soli]